MQSALLYLVPMLFVGDTSPILEHLPDTFLLIDDGELIDRLPPLKATYFDLSKDSFNPLRKIDHNKARALAEVIYAAFPQGQTTLTVRNGKRALTRLFLKADRLDKLYRSKEDDVLEANGVIDDLLLSPVLKNVLCRPTNISFKGTVIARLNRAELGDLDCFVLGNLLISHYQGHVVIPDFAFYGCPFHKGLIRQHRLTAGVHYLDETPFKNDLLRMETLGKHCTYQDACTLADHAGLISNTTAYTDFVKDAM